MSLTQAQAEAIATAIHRVRNPDHPQWDRAGVLAALRKAQDQGTPAAILRAAADLADNAELRTPALLPQPGPHWQRADGTSARRDSHAMRCPKHPSSVHPCPQCAADPGYVEPPADWRKDAEAGIEQAAKKYPHHTRKPYTPKEKP